MFTAFIAKDKRYALSSDGKAVANTMNGEASLVPNDWKVTE